MIKDIGLKILALTLAVVLWFSGMLLSEKTIDIYLPIQTVNIPDNLILMDSERNKNIRFKLTARGIDLAIFSLTKKGYCLVDASNFKYWNNVLKISGDNVILPEYVHYTKLETDPNKKILLKTDRIKSVRLPVKVKYAGEKDEIYFARKKMKINPSKCTVTGPEQKLKLIKTVETYPLAEQRIKNSHLETRLIIPKGAIQVQPETANIEIEETRIIQKMFSLLPIHYPHEQNVTIIPQKASVLLEGSEDILNNMKKSKIKISVKDKKLKAGQKQKLDVEIPPGLKIIKYTPQTVKVKSNE
ncbi:MAG: hypothetical protein CSB55_08185 [Candidatus Cloacimonadota bacterium]|nr:MAG: hypothetical protein CSB55_08185 [Candidatus Cloacimonadota bacterium]